MSESMALVGLDVHQARSVAALDRSSGELRVERLRGEPAVVVPVFLERLGRPVRAVYEAGPTGFGLARTATARGLDVRVVASGSIPRASGDRVKTDRRDAKRLVRLFAAGELSFAFVPSEADERFRDLVRCVDDARKDLMRSRHPASRRKSACSQRKTFSTTSAAVILWPSAIVVSPLVSWLQADECGARGGRNVSAETFGATRTPLHHFYRFDRASARARAERSGGVLVVPAGLDQQPAGVAIAALCDVAAVLLLARGIFARGEPEVADQLTRVGEAPEVADLGQQRERSRAADAAERAQPAHRALLPRPALAVAHAERRSASTGSRARSLVPWGCSFARVAPAARSGYKRREKAGEGWE
jgi:hypothetical protein